MAAYQDAGLAYQGTGSFAYQVAPSIPIEGADVWHGRRRQEHKKRKAWPLPPPQFPLETTTVLLPVLPEPPAPEIPSWQKPRGRYRGLVYRPPIETPIVETPTGPVRVVAHQDIAPDVETVSLAFSLDAKKRQRQRQRQEDDLIVALLMQGEL